MTFGCKMDDGTRLMLFEQSAQQLAIAHISLDEGIPWISSDPTQVAGITSVREVAEVDHRSSFLRDPLQDKVGTDESGPSGYKNRFFHMSRPGRVELWSFGD